MSSIHRRTLLWLLGGLLVIGSLAGIATYRHMLEEVNEMQDFELRQIAYSIEYTSRSLPENMDAGQQPIEDNPEFILQIWRHGALLQYSSQPSVALPLAAKQGLSIVTQGDEQWRVFSLHSGGRIVQAAQSMEDRQETSADMVLRMLVPFLILIPVLAALAWLAVRKGLAPLGQVAEDIGRRDSTTMQPLDETIVPTEIRPLVIALNDLLRRLANSMNAQRQFIADAAHELRTPLTALSLQAQLLEQSHDRQTRREAIRDLRQGIARASHMVQQLLSLARQEPDSPHAFCRIDLCELVRDKVGELAPLAAARDIDLGVDAGQAQWIEGDAASLNLLIGNLVDNAIRYTPSGGRVDVTLRADGGKVLLSVADSGPGIAVEEQERIFERFYRPAGQNESGSGLGLAIVRQVAQLHNANVGFEKPASGVGTVFLVSFHSPEQF
jgi:two-component system, OmpR family, sensor kinase